MQAVMASQTPNFSRYFGTYGYIGTGHPKGLADTLIDTGHFSLYVAIQGLKDDHLPNKEFEPTDECFNAGVFG